MKIFAISFLLLALFPSIASAQWTEDRLNQAACEEDLISENNLNEVMTGGAFEALREAAKDFDLEQTPHLYLFLGGGLPAYIEGSRFTDGKGKIIVTSELLEKVSAATDSGAVLVGMMGHEVAHLVADDGKKGCNDWLWSTPQIEQDAEALAALKVGYDPVLAFLWFVRGNAGSATWIVDPRIVALEKAREMLARLFSTRLKSSSFVADLR